jgi:hypothetical protein
MHYVCCVSALHIRSEVACSLNSPTYLRTKESAVSDVRKRVAVEVPYPIESDESCQQRAKGVIERLSTSSVLARELCPGTRRSSYQLRGAPGAICEGRHWHPPGALEEHVNGWDISVK